MWATQCGLCLSCGAPFEPVSGEVSFFNRRANLSILYLNEEFKYNRILQGSFEGSKFCSAREGCHIIHKSHHGAAVRYMSLYHESDSAPKFPANAANGRAVLVAAAKNGPMPYFMSETGKGGPHVAVWDKPPEDERVGLENLVAFAVDHADEQTANSGQNLDLTFAICKACNSLMTGLSYARFLVGFGSVSDKNENATIIHAGDTPIKQRVADPKNTDVQHAMGKWDFSKNSGSDVALPNHNASDPTAPFVAYYLHACLPYAVRVGEFPPELNRLPVRCFYVEMSWILLEIAAISCLIQQGKQNRGEKLSHGIQQHYGVLDIYVSYFLWRMIRYEMAKTCRLSFVQWHQKYFWDAVNIPGVRVSGIKTIGLMVCRDTRVGTAELVGGICDALCGIYSTSLNELVSFVSRNPIVAANSDDARFISQYFVSPKRLVALERRWVQVCARAFSSAGVLASYFIVTRESGMTSRGRSRCSASTRCWGGPSSCAPRRCWGFSRISGGRGRCWRSIASAPRPRGSP